MRASITLGKNPHFILPGLHLNLAGWPPRAGALDRSRHTASLCALPLDRSPTRISFPSQLAASALDLGRQQRLTRAAPLRLLRRHSIDLATTPALSARRPKKSSTQQYIRSSNKKKSIITHLPGFLGPLPFQFRTGYVEVDESNRVCLFYYFIESERNLEDDPLILWLTGGPGCSAFSGLVYEIGPLSFDLHGYVDGLPQLVYKPDSWTKVSNVIFLDSPVGAGFSYSETEQGYNSSDTKAVNQIVVFLTKDENGSKMVNQYVHLSKIGAGSYGKVVLYRSMKDGKLYAVKNMSATAMGAACDDAIEQLTRLLDQFEPPLKKTFQNVHQGYPTETLVRFLKARELHVTKAHKMLVDSLDWRIQNEIDSILEKPIIPVDLYRSIRETQLIGLSGYSKEGLPIFAIGVGLSTYDKALNPCSWSWSCEIVWRKSPNTKHAFNVVKPLLQERTRKKVHVLHCCGRDELLLWYFWNLISGTIRVICSIFCFGIYNIKWMGES